MARNVLRLSEDYGASTVLRALRFLCARLRPFSEAESIRTELEQWRLELWEAQEAFDLFTARIASW
mgnify:CR=1 FL=1